jgi:hypothetical protein
MLKTKLVLKEIMFDDKKFRRELESQITQVLQEAVYMWIQAVVPNVPVYTGMARASLKPLAAWLLSKGFDADVPINPKRNDNWARSRLAEGPSFGKGSKFLTVRSNQYGAFQYVFDWYTLVPHWLFLETDSHPNVASAPWHALDAGFVAMDNYIDTNLRDRIPQIHDYIFERKV